MKHLTITLLLLVSFTIGQLHAQRFNAKKIKSYTVWTVDGTAHYSKNDGEKMAITPGMLLSNDASVSLADGASVRLANDNELVSLSGKGDYQLNSNLKENTSNHSAATKPFFNLLAASTMYSGAKMMASDDGSGYGDGSGKKSSDDGSGYGDGSGKKSSDDGSGYGDGSAKKPSDDGSGYGDGSAKKSSDDGSGYGDGSGKKSSDDGSGYGDGSEKKSSDDGSGYGDGSGKKSSDDGSGYGTKKAMKAKKRAVLTPLKSDNVYRSGDKVNKFLMRATALDNAGLNNDAKKFYKKALTKKPNDPVASQLYLAFLKRNK